MAFTVKNKKFYQARKSYLVFDSYTGRPIARFTEKRHADLFLKTHQDRGDTGVRMKEMQEYR